ncbi:MAG: hypothetical protein J0H55_16100 [Chitinophagaceae bacterium]|nr:hypothetical protein [Chitinophagaceae bacterium]
MQNKLLLPHKWKRIGWIILIPSFVFGLYLIIFGIENVHLNARTFAILDIEILKDTKIFSFISTNISATIAGSLFITGSLLVGFSKEKVEDEFISNLRLTSLLWAVLVNYILLLFAFLFIYGLPFFDVMVYNCFTILIFFIVRFNYVLYRNFKKAGREK